MSNCIELTCFLDECTRELLFFHDVFIVRPHWILTAGAQSPLITKVKGTTAQIPPPCANYWMQAFLTACSRAVMQDTPNVQPKSILAHLTLASACPNEVFSWRRRSLAKLVFLALRCKKLWVVDCNMLDFFETWNLNTLTKSIQADPNRKDKLPITKRRHTWKIGRNGGFRVWKQAAINSRWEFDPYRSDG